MPKKGSSSRSCRKWGCGLERSTDCKLGDDASTLEDVFFRRSRSTRKIIKSILKRKIRVSL